MGVHQSLFLPGQIIAHRDLDFSNNKIWLKIHRLIILLGIKMGLGIGIGLEMIMLIREIKKY